MADPFINPLDTSPLDRARPSRPDWNPSAGNTGGRGDFNEIFQSALRQEATPIGVPKPIGAEINETAARRSADKPAGPPPEFPRVLVVPKIDEGESADVSLTPPPVPEPPAAPAQPSNLREAMNGPAAAGDAETKTQPTAEVHSATPSEPPAEPAPAETPAVVLDHDTPEPTGGTYTIRKGDTLSGIVAGRLTRMGIDYSTGDLYRMVRQVAAHNGIENPNLIYSGDTIDLAPLGRSESAVAAAGGTDGGSEPGARPPIQGAITSRFGMRMHPVLNEMKFHKGIDIQAETGTPVTSIKPGVVTFSGEMPGYGQIVEVGHEDGTHTRYAHLSERMVAPGDSVSPDRPIALTGNTGRTTGPHLHFEIRENGRPVDPLHYFRESDFGGARIALAGHDEPQSGS